MIDWSSIDTVLLDMDGTLLDLHYDNHFWNIQLPKLYADQHAISAAEAHEHLHGAYANERGTLQWYCLDHWSERLRMDIPTLKRTVANKIALRPHVSEFLQRIKASNRDLLLVTNAHQTTLEIKMEVVDIQPWFDRVVVSHALNAPKEDQDFWHRLQALHPFDPARTLLIDDTESILEAASTYGIAHLLTLLQPDSQQEMRSTTRFPAIHHFNEIMPTESPQ
ncbi:MAG: GMP/IMP nucleotidase [Halioglobus sp.]